jgi:hypothetical protein
MTPSYKFNITSDTSAYNRLKYQIAEMLSSVSYFDVLDGLPDRIRKLHGMVF